MRKALLWGVSVLGLTTMAWGCGDTARSNGRGPAGTSAGGGAGGSAGAPSAGTAGAATGGTAGSATAGGGGNGGASASGGTGGTAGDGTDAMAGEGGIGAGGEETGGTAGSGNGGASGSGGASASGGVSGSGGASGSGGTGGSSGASGSGGTAGGPNTDPVVADKIDLLFMIDNSISMADKQEILSQAVPVLVRRLISPMCVDDNGDFTGDAFPCATGSEPEFQPIEDIHVGVITSSLGDHGSADVCSAESTDTTYNDKAQFVPTVYPTLPIRSGLSSWNNQGFLVWDPREATDDVTPHMPPGYGSALSGSPGDDDAFIAAFADHVAGSGEHGCGYEGQLESWYRFLVDPEPVTGLTNNGQVNVRGAVNQTVLAQRDAFLRPDSMLAIVMLSDENDCSILDENNTQGWLVAYKGGVNVNSWRMPRAHQICATDPNNVNCAPCRAGDPDPGCAGGTPYTPADDALNVRCYRQKQRFGIDLLYPVRRYVEGLSQSMIDPRLNGVRVPNPIFAAESGDAAPRDPRLIVLAGIVGVPWQDIATPETVGDARALEYMTAAELQAADRWDVILGDPENAVDPTDPFMIESIDPRTTGAANPVVPSVTILASTSTTLNAINGHEQAVIQTERADLQFACIFPLPTPVVCSGSNAASCDCTADQYAKSSPLCNYPSANVDGTQERGKAYPGLRELSVLKGLGPNGIVASICPKNIMPQGGTDSDPNYGYNPAMTALVKRMKEGLGGRP